MKSRKKEGEDCLRIDGLRLRTVLGVRPEERTAPREVAADLAVGIDLSQAGASDELTDTLDWAAVAESVRAFAAGASFRLAEALAEGISALLLRDPRVRWARVRIEKPGAVDGAGSVSAEVFRPRPPAGRG